MAKKLHQVDMDVAQQAAELRIAWVYDMDACRGPTGVTRHALAQLEHLMQRRNVRLSVVSGRMTEPDGLAHWESLEAVPRRELPIRTRNALRAWRLVPWPPLELWTGPVDWVYCPAEYFLPTRKARRAVTSHDVLQDLRFGSARRRALLERVFNTAHLILSVSEFNTRTLLDAFPDCRDRVAHVPNGAEELFFEPASPEERAAVRADLGLPPGIPYLVSVANFQPRKNLVRLIQAATGLREVAQGDLALVLLGDGSGEQIQTLREAIASAPGRALIRMPGYRQGKGLRAVYAEATALVFPSLCESFGIPVVEAMAQGLPVALANSTALPEVGGATGWYFDPENTEAIASALRSLLDQPEERARRVALGREQAELFHWQRSNDCLLQALMTR